MINVKAWAKLNLNLHLMPKGLKNGYYPVKFINCEIDLHDKLFIKKIKNKIKIVSSDSELPTEKHNLIYKAAYLIKKFTNKKEFGAEIVLKKNIPVKSGLGGGSSDGAATLKGLLKLWQVKITNNQLFIIIRQLGKDAFYCFEGGLCHVKGDGSKITPLNYKLPRLWLIIIAPEISKPSTAWMYQSLDCTTIGRNLDKIKKLKKAILNKDKGAIYTNLHNDFENLAALKFPIIDQIKKELTAAGAKATLMAGSGLSVVGFFESKKEAIISYRKLKIKYKKIFYASTK
ncbi:4-(cytidine 5'-diphospho)-2-C-methyl-D-erythritol kinase [Candidatus Roizmanbacteria bacterium CG02_land_8_20_14_3_00_36_15]|uniref:4-diphosphocytidyl-2-C-methyl-D-erythritol kinase n=1 Tax=Candidatus Roizmanbacteria bacterium CG10_big_fil_rev_8_21_14_0_10_36_26 TaxID=1974851 RepID=A0A2M8KLH9_9BACT|nr:MAG: 4-(cytidine 5'-diphospho)-2-C-methyl-D-erythritol kinase [Candidatus Roizmanbacteria bacterium CG03_land_8_20_14_0_80_36_21]PIV37699.1 MAG: 4-(cytidine 5'-diphospho)-2-C-methyl-D-erythritol kinase [Candidatus Roizmanbacteria bacterium CG02_land_8_20_14_3_00_36_15]PIY69656.1 MAG: 4-(cytidine 5'-diphospho)-2-C-methyl-D-erythritol kinase [Candidatus Roizmanbacteria bacterium CG_4_10_14_0_8_um_filter_36_36]PJA53529.1 MAG: 4-(cytidine 5'-diphospho)-2-C-methyl-D-erythritol kinase [Candidatus R